MIGLVYLVDAGPGDPGLITVKGLDAVKRADVIVYDHLVHPALLRQARKEAELICVGKKTDPSVLFPSAINALLIQKAKECKSVVRLKASNSFVFDWGSEEIEELIKAQISFEVIPGITSAITAPNDAGISVMTGQAGEPLPFFGQRILVTRARKQSEELLRKIAELDGVPIDFPVIEIVRPKKLSPLDEALRNLSSFDWLIFTSVNGVAFFFERLQEKKIDCRQISQHAKIVAVGSRTAEALMQKGLFVDLVPKKFYAEELLKTLKPHLHKGDKILLPRANIARKLLPEQLEAWGCDVTAVDAYETQQADQDASEIVKQLKAGQIDVITFTSSSTVRHFVQLVQEVTDPVAQLFQGVKIACIGPIAANTAEELGFQVDVIADPSTIEGLVLALQNDWEKRG